MKILHLSSSDINGGAARAAYSIHDALLKNKINSKILVQEKLSNDTNVASILTNSYSKLQYSARFTKDYLSIKFFTKESKGRFSFPFWGVNLTQNNLVNDSDILQLHWINQAFLSLKNLEQLFKLNKPIVWTLHDMWAFTGGCHYSGNCLNYLKICRECPALKYNGKNDFSKRIFKSKENFYKNFNITIVASSKWLADEAKKSFLFQDKKIKTIPTAVNINIYKPFDKKLAREKLNIKTDKILILFGTMNLKEERKGFKYLIKSLELLHSKNHLIKEKIEILIFGKSEQNQFREIPFNTRILGRISGDENLAFIYNAADIFVAPSLQDNLPNTVMEALSCGIPAVTFNIGGMSDMIDHKINGYLAVSQSVEDLSNGILWFIEEISSGKNFKDSARNKVLNSFTSEIVAKKYLELYTSILNEH